MRNRLVFVHLMIFLFFLTGISAPSSAQNLHALIFCDTIDSEIGSGNSVTFQYLEGRLKEMAKQAGLKLNPHYYMGDDFKKSSFSKAVTDLSRENLKEDVLLFYFIGHGYNNEDKKTNWPSPIFKISNEPMTEEEVKERSIDLENIDEELMNLSPRLLLVVSESCNNILGSNLIKQGNAMGIFSQMSFADAGADPEKYQRLFRLAKGKVLITSSKKYKPSWLHPIRGGLFSMTFLEAMKEMTRSSYEGEVTWKKLLENTIKNTITAAKAETLDQEPDGLEKVVYEPMDEFMRSNKKEEPGISRNDGETERNAPPSSKEKVNFFQKVIGFFVPSKIKRKFHQYYKQDGSVRRLEEVIALAENSEKLEKKIKKETPISYYLASAIIFDYKRDTTNAMREYCTACAIDSATNRSNREIDVIAKIQNMDRRSDILGINNYPNYGDWLKEKCRTYKAKFKKDIKDVDEEISKIKKEIDNLEKAIEQDTLLLDQTQKEIRELEARKEAIDIHREKDVSLATDLREDQEYVAMKLKGIKEDIRTGNIVDEIYEEQFGNTSLKITTKKRSADNNIEVGSTQYDLGKFCTDEMKRSIRILMETLLLEIKEVPLDSIDQIEVSVKIIGNADWRGGRHEKLNIKYVPSKDIRESYTNIDAEKRSFVVRAGETVKLSNEELAFMRCYCVKETVEEILNANKINKRKRDYIYQAIVHPKDGSDGSDYRGIDLEMEIKNLYKHHMDEIKEIDRRIEILNSKEETIARDIDDKLDKIGELRDSIDDKKQKKENLELKLGNLNPDRANNLINQKIEEVKRLRSK